MSDTSIKTQSMSRRLTAIAALWVFVLGLIATTGQTLAADSKRLPVPERRLFDLTVGDFSADGDLDISTTAHSYRPILLENNGRAQFADRTPARGIQHLLQFPSFDNMDQAPKLTSPGVYVYQAIPGKNNDFVTRIVAHQVPAKITLSNDPKRNFKKITVTNGTQKQSQTATSSSLELNLQPGGRADVAISLDADMKVTTNQPTYVGPQVTRAPQATFALRLADVHAQVLFDLNNDGRDDMMQVVGGWGGAIDYPGIRGKIHDIMRLWNGSQFVDTTTPINKDNCRGRMAAAGDYNGDGRTDIFQTCEDQLDGEVGLPFVTYNTIRGWQREIIPAPGHVYRWVQSGDNSIPKLLALNNDQASLWQRAAAGWQKVSQTKLHGEHGQTTLGDFNRDGNPDIMVSSRKGNSLLTLNGAQLQSRKPSSIGLPDNASASVWVDYDNDGDLDLHSLPKGVHLQNNKDKFVSIGRLMSKPGYYHLSWADFDEDGLREPIIGNTPGEFADKGKAYWFGTKVPAKATDKKWLQIDLPGGLATSRVTIKPNTGAAQVHWAGESESSRFSQTHNRVYANGFPKKADSAVVTVRMPNGQMKTFQTKLNRVVQLPR